jgi:hypothetical protein
MFYKFDTSSGHFVKHLSRTQAAEQSATKIILMTFAKLDTNKVAAEDDLLFYRHWPLVSKFYIFSVIE